jgi:valyl-tRNA synthetase
MRLLHPFMPFITEEIYQLLNDQSIDLCVSQYATENIPDNALLQQGELLKQVISALRDARNKNQLKPKETITLFIETATPAAYSLIGNILAKQINAVSIQFTTTAVSNTIVVAIEKDKFYIQSEKQLDTVTLKADLLKDLEHQQNFLQSVIKKLSNERFVQNAKTEVIALEQKKKEDTEARIQTIKESLASLN